MRFAKGDARFEKRGPWTSEQCDYMQRFGHRIGDPEAIGLVTIRIDDLLAQCKAMRDHIDLEGFGRINIGLHKAVQQLIQNRSLIAISDTLFYQTSRMWF